MPAFVDLTGKKFGRLTVVKKYGRKQPKGPIHWHCICECGNEKIADGESMKRGNVESCGCKQHDRNKSGTNGRSHGMSQSRQYRIWSHMLGRCNNPTDDGYGDYGGRGIKVCERWHIFENFLEDIKNEYDHSLTIDRIDNNGNYEPSNVRWATQKQQQRNKRSNVLVTVDGETSPMAHFAERYGIRNYHLYHRLKLGWSLERALKTPIRKCKPRAQ